MKPCEVVNVRLGAGEGSVVLLDQTQLPNRVVYREVSALEDMVEAIQKSQIKEDNTEEFSADIDDGTQKEMPDASDQPSKVSMVDEGV